jgi:hypothetical protein
MTAPALQTAERRARATRPPLPRLRVVLLEQLRATGFALRGAGMIAVSLVALITFVVLLQGVTRETAINLYEWPTLFPGLVGVLLPIAVWARDERFGPGFLWTLPVDRRRHAFTKVGAGWVWLMGGIALFALWHVALTLASGGRVMPPETLYVLTTSLPTTGPLDPATLKTLPWAPGPLVWAVPFTAATASYLLASAVVLGTRHPLRWVIGVSLTYALLSVAGTAASAKLGMGWIADAHDGALERLIEGSYGLDALLTARIGTLSTTTALTTGERAMVWRAVPDLADWRIATMIWTGAGLIALWAAASRHRERRRA